MAGGMGQVGSRAIALGPIAQHELHNTWASKDCMSHTMSFLNFLIKKYSLNFLIKKNQFKKFSKLLKLFKKFRA